MGRGELAKEDDPGGSEKFTEMRLHSLKERCPPREIRF